MLGCNDHMKDFSGSCSAISSSASLSNSSSVSVRNTQVHKETYFQHLCTLYQDMARSTGRHYGLCLSESRVTESSV